MFKKIIAISIASVIITCLALGVYLSYHYINTMPGTPQPADGRVYQFNVHGTIVYLTGQEDLQLKWLFRGMIFFIIIAFLFTYFFNPFKQNK